MISLRGTRGDPVVETVWVSVLGSPGSGLTGGYCVEFLGSTLYSHAASLYPCVMDTDEFNAEGNPAMH